MPKKTTCRYIFKSQKNKNKILKEARRMRNITFRGTKIIAPDFSSKTIQEQEWNEIFNILNEKNLTNLEFCIQQN